MTQIFPKLAQLDWDLVTLEPARVQWYELIRPRSVFSNLLLFNFVEPVGFDFADKRDIYYGLLLQ